MRLELDFGSPEPWGWTLSDAFCMIFPEVSRNMRKLPELSHPQMMSEGDAASQIGLHFSLVNLQMSFGQEPPKQECKHPGIAQLMH